MWFYSPLQLFGEYTEVVYNTYTMATQDSPDKYASAFGPVALGLGHIYQANPEWSWYNYYLHHNIYRVVISLNRDR